ncbi:hypothetical protein NA56DRAFT_647675 [Hyaloscypha hepaticicola]|uniref:Uncharacterized protein n=1 Tax=Hyaloscypha hepaticicola TaxID=2082293 RepID=A0A2J6PXP3_9HELO|nr:hypothetical protein NA56DRAFT_647675 [Hyaloscypha hepaticicola]
MAIAVYYDLSDNRYAEPRFSLCSQLKHVWHMCLQLLGASLGGQDNVGLRPRGWP